MPEQQIQHDLVGNSPAMAETIRVIARVARTRSTVLIQGESGTGKELAARAIHRNSPRAAGPFVAINCAAFAESLVESELFGHEKGSFTGALAQKAGKFEQAAGGTLFLDEVGELAPSIQAKLLRVIEQREVDRIGGRAPIPIDIRLIAATNRDLESAVADGEFREDLYYRLNVLSVTTPPLRERRDDIPALVRLFIAKHGNLGEPAVRGISTEAESILFRYNWPGNVRQLQNVIEQAVSMCSAGLIQPSDLPRAVFANRPRRSQTEPQTLEQAVLQTKRQAVENAVCLASGDLNRAAAILGVHPKGMHRLLFKLNLPHLVKRPAA